MSGLVGFSSLLVIAVVAVFIHLRPGTYRVERSIQICAPVDRVYAYVNDLRQWALWSPFEKLDPFTKKKFTDPAAGTGACAWNGDRKVGEIIASKVVEFVIAKMEFRRLFARKILLLSIHEVRFNFTSTEAGTQVTWLIEGKNEFFAKAYQLFVSADARIGKDFTVGLANLDRIARLNPSVVLESKCDNTESELREGSIRTKD